MAAKSRHERKADTTHCELLSGRDGVGGVTGPTSAELIATEREKKHSNASAGVERWLEVRVPSLSAILACFEAMVAKDRLYHRAGAALALGTRDMDHR